MARRRAASARTGARTPTRWRSRSRACAADQLLHGMLNAYWEPLDVRAPVDAVDGSQWRLCIDTALALAMTSGHLKRRRIVAAGDIVAQPRTVVVLGRRTHRRGWPSWCTRGYRRSMTPARHPPAMGCTLSNPRRGGYGNRFTSFGTGKPSGVSAAGTPGGTDVPLTEKGRRIARENRHRCSASREFRAGPVEPAAAGAADQRARRLRRARRDRSRACREWDYGHYEGLTPAQIHVRRPNWMIFATAVRAVKAPRRSALASIGVIARVRAISDDVALFAHGHVFRVFAARWLGLPAQRRHATFCWIQRRSAF